MILRLDFFGYSLPFQSDILHIISVLILMTSVQETLSGATSDVGFTRFIPTVCVNCSVYLAGCIQGSGKQNVNLATALLSTDRQTELL